MANITVTHTFVNGTVADATEVNTNFTDIVNGTSDGTKDFSINALTLAGALTANGNVTLGNATGDTITPTGRFAGDIDPSADNARDIGASGLAFKAVYTYDTFASLGAVGTPSYSFDGDTDTGMWSSAANILNFSAGGTEILELDGTSADFTVDVHTTGNLGVGTSSPGAEIEVANSGSVWIQVNSSGGGNVDTGIEFQHSSATQWKINNQGGTANDDLSITNASGTTIIHAEQGGNVGIGVTSLSNKFTVKGSGNTNATTAILIENSDGTNMFSIDDDGDSHFTLGNVGIGTTSPNFGSHSTALTISNTGSSARSGIEIEGNSSNANGVIQFYNNSTLAGFIENRSSGSGGRMTFNQNSVDTMSIQNGNVGIGTTSPDHPLHIEGADTKGLHIGAAGGQDLWLYGDNSIGALIATNVNLALSADSGTTQHLIVNTSGDVGIGDSTPATKLDIAGDCRATGGYYIGAFNGNNLLDDASTGAGSTTCYIGNASIDVTSDERLKKIQGPTKINATDLLGKIKIFDFVWDDPTDTSFNNRNARGVWTGFSAQQVVKHIPTMINAPRKEKTLELDYKSEARWKVDPTAAIPLMFKAIQELNAKIEKLEAA